MEQDLIKSQFMFYFALENGVQCPNYMTEKLWDSLSRGSIPIYVGWDGIEDYIPSKSLLLTSAISTPWTNFAASWNNTRPTKSCTKKRTNGRRKPENLARRLSQSHSTRLLGFKSGMCNTLRQLTRKGHVKDQESESVRPQPDCVGRSGFKKSRTII